MEMQWVLTPLTRSSVVVTHVAIVQPNDTPVKLMAVCVSLVARSIIKGYDGRDRRVEIR